MAMKKFGVYKGQCSGPVLISITSSLDSEAKNQANKMSRVVLTFLVALAIFHANVEAGPTCPGQNEVYSQCLINCIPTCAQPQVSGCSYSCPGPGCLCQEGYLRNNAGVCVHPSQC